MRKTRKIYQTNSDEVMITDAKKEIFEKQSINYANQSFIGEMTGVNIWDHVLKDREIAPMSKSCLTGVSNMFQWVI